MGGAILSDRPSPMHRSYISNRQVGTEYAALAVRRIAAFCEQVEDWASTPTLAIPGGICVHDIGDIEEYIDPHLVLFGAADDSEVDKTRG